MSIRQVKYDNVQSMYRLKGSSINLMQKTVTLKQSVVYRESNVEIDMTLSISLKD